MRAPGDGDGGELRPAREEAGAGRHPGRAVAERFVPSGRAQGEQEARPGGRGGGGAVRARFEHGLRPRQGLARVRGVGVSRRDELLRRDVLPRPLPRHQGEARDHVQARPCGVASSCTSTLLASLHAFLCFACPAPSTLLQESELVRSHT